MHHIQFHVPISDDPIESCNWVEWFSSLSMETETSIGFEAVESWSSKLWDCLPLLLLWLLLLLHMMFLEELCTAVGLNKNMDSLGFGNMFELQAGGGGGQGTVVKFVSPEWLRLEAVRDRQAGCKAWASDLRRPILHKSWCSMKLSTLQHDKRKTFSEG